jgi:uncharacterized protein (DUF4415 family)
MAKALYGSSQPAKRIRVKAADIFSKPLNKRQTAMIGRLKATADADIDYSDIPPLTDEQLDEMVRGKFYRKPKELVSVRLEPEVLQWLRDFGPGYLTRINDILRTVMQQARARQSR